jgi:hypothetical protein
MTGTFKLNTTAHPTVNYVVFHGVTGIEYKITGTNVALTNPYDIASARLLYKGGVRLLTET